MATKKTTPAEPETAAPPLAQQAAAQTTKPDPKTKPPFEDPPVDPPIEPPPPVKPPGPVTEPIPVPGVELIYEHVTLRLGPMEMHIARLEENRWRLYAQLNYITLATVEWMYDEVFEGDEQAAYVHATQRLKELTELKVTHDSVHDRVRRMSEGEA